eukprot:SM001098S18861  [mRNA]  locus=s1098:1406:1600:+ [translate_table: standard]
MLQVPAGRLRDLAVQLRRARGPALLQAPLLATVQGEGQLQSAHKDAKPDQPQGRQGCQCCCRRC